MTWVSILQNKSNVIGLVTLVVPSVELPIVGLSFYLLKSGRSPSSIRA